MSDEVAWRAATRPAISPAEKKDIPAFAMMCGKAMFPIISGVRTIATPSAMFAISDRQDMRSAKSGRSDD